MSVLEETVEDVVYWLKTNPFLAMARLILLMFLVISIGMLISPKLDSYMGKLPLYAKSLIMFSFLLSFAINLINFKL